MTSVKSREEEVLDRHQDALEQLFHDRPLTIGIDFATEPPHIFILLADLTDADVSVAPKDLEGVEVRVGRGLAKALATTGVTQEEAELVLNAHGSMLELEFPDHTGIGVAMDDGELVIRIKLPRVSPHRRAAAPKELDGVRLVLQEEDGTGDTRQA